MRIKHRRSLFGYSQEAVAKVVDSMREEFEEQRRRLEAELDDYNRAIDRMIKEIVLRKKELNELAEMEKEQEGLLQQKNVESAVEQELPMEQPRLVLVNKKIN